jgi:hypothetical protein
MAGCKQSEETERRSKVKNRTLKNEGCGTRRSKAKASFWANFVFAVPKGTAPLTESQGLTSFKMPARWADA